jgi:hypothetical protein
MLGWEGLLPSLLPTGGAENVSWAFLAEAAGCRASGRCSTREHALPFSGVSGLKGPQRRILTQAVFTSGLCWEGCSPASRKPLFALLVTVTILEVETPSSRFPAAASYLGICDVWPLQLELSHSHYALIRLGLCFALARSLGLLAFTLLDLSGWQLVGHEGQGC